MVALDAMGGDYAPTVTVQGAINAAKKGIKIGLYGDQAQLCALLDRMEPSWQHLPISIIHCSQVIDMGEEPTRGVLRKKDASLVRAIEAVAQGQATAIVSAGNSGAALVGGSLILGRAEGIIRPALGDFLPETNGKPSLFCMDLGANIDCKPEHLEQFAYMGHVYVKQVKGIERPRIALLSNGAEPYKGPAIVKKAYDILSSSSLNFVGNLEARDVFEGRADVLVCDGFAGNVLIKAMQGTAYAVRQWLKQERDKSFINRVIFMLSAGVFAGLAHKMSYAQRKGGSLLLGLKAPLIVAHGSSSAHAIENAIYLAHTTVQNNFIATFNKEIALVMAQKALFGVKSIHATHNVR